MNGDQLRGWIDGRVDAKGFQDETVVAVVEVLGFDVAALDICQSIDFELRRSCTADLVEVGDG